MRSNVILCERQLGFFPTANITEESLNFPKDTRLLSATASSFYDNIRVTFIFESPSEYFKVGPEETYNFIFCKATTITEVNIDGYEYFTTLNIDGIHFVIYFKK